MLLNAILIMRIYLFIAKPLGYKEYTTSKLVNIFLDKSIVCSWVPMHNQMTATFIIDMENIKDSMDLITDDNGAWLHNSLWCVWVSVCKNKVETSTKWKCKSSTAYIYIYIYIYILTTISKRCHLLAPPHPLLSRMLQNKIIFYITCTQMFN